MNNFVKTKIIAYINEEFKAYSFFTQINEVFKYLLIFHKLKTNRKGGEVKGQ
jgi:hypothetical protein